MNGTETAVVQIGSIAITSGALIGILKWLVPYIIHLWAEKQKEVAEVKRRNIEAQIENEKFKKQASEDAIHANRAMVQVLQTAMNSVNGQIDSLKTSLRHTDGNLEKLLSFMPVIEKMKLILDGIEKRKAQPDSKPLAGKERFPDQEHIVEGDKHIIKNKPSTDGKE